ncbi:hypothetical protein ACFFLZ_06040 [Photobacterium aphoticum]|nr:hypothetical protein [Photobacterium aphoticum]
MKNGSMKRYSYITMMMFASACTSQANTDSLAEQKIKFIEDECYVVTESPLAGPFNAFMVERQEELKTLRDELSQENYAQLDFALQHFSTHWDKLQTERNLACEVHATCQFIWLKSPELQSNTDFCDGADFEYSVTRAKIITFFNDIERIELQRAR